MPIPAGPPSTDLPAWAPTLEQVADHVPYLTVNTTNPTTQTYLGTFATDTTPTDNQATRHIEDAASNVSPYVDLLPASWEPAATTAVMLRAAASLARAFPRHPQDLDTADRLDVRADAALKVLTEAVGEVDKAANLASAALPLWSFPEPPAWGDLLL